MEDWAQCCCGNVTLDVDNQPARVVVFHCYSCQLSTASALISIYEDWQHPWHTTACRGEAL